MGVWVNLSGTKYGKDVVIRVERALEEVFLVEGEPFIHVVMRISGGGFGRWVEIVAMT